MHEHRKLNERGISQLNRGYFVGNRAARKVSSTRKSLRIFYFFFFFPKRLCVPISFFRVPLFYYTGSVARISIAG